MKVDLFYIARANRYGEMIMHECPFETIDDCREVLSKHAYTWKEFTVLKQTVNMDVVDVSDPREYSYGD